MNIGLAIRKLRTEHGMSQTQLGEKCGLTANAISALEIGKTSPQKATIVRMCEVFGIPTALLHLSAIEEGDFPEEKRVLYRVLLEPLRNELLKKTDDDEKY